MVTDERFFAFMKHLLHRVADLETKLWAVEMVLTVNYAEDFAKRVADTAAFLESKPALKEFRTAIDTLEFAEILDSFEKYKGTVH